MLDQIENDTDANVYHQYLQENQHNLNDYQIQQHQLMQLQQFQQIKSQSEKLNQKYKKYSTPNLTQPNQAQFNNNLNDNLDINLNNNYNNENKQKKDNCFKHKPQQQQAYISSFNLICNDDNNQPDQLQKKQNQEQEISSSLKLKLKLNSDYRRFMNVIFQGQRIKLDRQFQQEDDIQNKNPQDKFLDSIKFSLEMMKKKQQKNKSFHESQDKNKNGKSLNNGPTAFQSKMAQETNQID
ncbi:hypothetical protein PPERSA_03650 [Pseudocohnilembus persalinus]|uniref:Uncharacterized protein n=1 Tax=Pseudocohnilembus persalinus TaxID=266149 RepID=A0A0V0R767_PSEPJ|nr:hypothetical protein PPERSA_03650 [Pseudocohnilembus persalinus]|eukprot:KRX10343.1 hypothetical protein PPERSA_03650 [Pseudocohnilembus persalinus]